MTAEAITLAPEIKDDWWEVEAIYDLCFAPGRGALSSYRLRDGVLPISSLCFTARDGLGVLAAAIRYWPVRVGGHDVALLGPVAVHPTRQGEGLAALLMYRSMAAARKQGWDRVLLVGDRAYYSRFGFICLEQVTMPPPTNPDRVLGIALRDMAWDGVVGDVCKWGE